MHKTANNKQSKASVKSVAPPYKWIDDPKAEWVMNKLGIKFEKGILRLDGSQKIDWDTTLKNTGRTGRALDSDKVDDFICDMLDGAEFPRPIIARTETGPVPVAGVHRTTAAVRAELPAINCYYVDLQYDYQFVALAVRTNRTEGDRVGSEAATRYALQLVFEYDITIKNATNMLGVNLHTLQSLVRQQRLKNKVRDAGFSGVLNGKVAEGLGPVSQNAKVMLAVAECARDMELSGEATADLAKRVAEGSSEAQQLDILKKERNDLEVVRAVQPGPTLQVRTLFLRHWRSLRNVIRKRTLTELQIVQGSDEHNRLKKEWREFRGELDAIFAK